MPSLAQCLSALPVVPLSAGRVNGAASANLRCVRHCARSSQAAPHFQATVTYTETGPHADLVRASFGPEAAYSTESRRLRKTGRGTHPEEHFVSALCLTFS